MTSSHQLYKFVFFFCFCFSTKGNVRESLWEPGTGDEPAPAEQFEGVGHSAGRLEPVPLFRRIPAAPAATGDASAAAHAAPSERERLPPHGRRPPQRPLHCRKQVGSFSNPVGKLSCTFVSWSLKVKSLSLRANRTPSFGPTSTFSPSTPSSFLLWWRWVWVVYQTVYLQ